MCYLYRFLYAVRVRSVVLVCFVIGSLCIDAWAGPGWVQSEGVCLICSCVCVCIDSYSGKSVFLYLGSKGGTGRVGLDPE